MPPTPVKRSILECETLDFHRTTTIHIQKFFVRLSGVKLIVIRSAWLMEGKSSVLNNCFSQAVVEPENPWLLMKVMFCY